MKYTIISRDELLKLIKFGTIDQNINYIVDEKNQQKFIREVLKSLPYDDSFGYVVIEFTYEENFSISNIQTLVKLDIKDIINIYCLTNEALDFYKSKFNPKIKFKLFENQELIKEVNSYKLIEDKKKGIEALFDIFTLNLKSIKERFSAEYISELLNYKENNYLNQEYKNFYFDLFCYERKNSFYKEDVGFIADIRAISRMEKIREDKETFLSGNYVKLSNQTDKEKIKFTLKKLVIDSIEKVQKSDKQTDEEKNEIIRNLVVAAIFLKSQKLLNTESREQNYWENFINLVNEFKEDFLDETKEALWYLGVFLGYKYLYDDYYNFLDFKIFKEDLEFSNVLINEEESENELAKLKQENEELSKKITDLEMSIQNNNERENIQDKNSSIEINLIDPTKEEIEQKNKELEDINQDTSTLDNENTNIDIVVETKTYEDNESVHTESYEATKTFSPNDKYTIKEEFLFNLPIITLYEILYRLDTKKNTLKELKSKYNEDNKQELIETILKQSLL